MELSPEDMRKLSRAAEEQPLASTPGAGPAPAQPASPASRDPAPKPGAPGHALPQSATPAPASTLPAPNGAEVHGPRGAPPNPPKEAPNTPPSLANPPADATRVPPASGRAPAPTPSAALLAPSTKAQAEHLLHTPHEAVQSKLPTAPPPPAALPRAQTAAPSTPPLPQANAAVAPSAPPTAQANPTATSGASAATRDNPLVTSGVPLSPAPLAQAAAASGTPSRGAGARPPQALPSTDRHPTLARKSATPTGVPAPLSVKLGSLRNRSPALLAGGTLAAVAAALLIVGTAGLWSTPPAHGIEQQQAEPALPNPPRPQPPLAAPEAPAAVAPATAPQQPTEPQPTTPVRFKNPFDRSEIFEFPAGTTLEDARQSVAGLLLQRARDRRHPRMAQQHNINSVDPARPARVTDLAQNAVRGR